MQSVLDEPFLLAYEAYLLASGIIYVLQKLDAGISQNLYRAP